MKLNYKKKILWDETEKKISKKKQLKKTISQTRLTC